LTIGTGTDVLFTFGAFANGVFHDKFIGTTGIWTTSHFFSLFLFSLNVLHFTLPLFSIGFFLNTINYIEKQGEFQAEFQKDKLSKSIYSFVLCPGCWLPSWISSIRKRNIIPVTVILLTY
jgi:hypothetical protein